MYVPWAGHIFKTCLCPDFLSGDGKDDGGVKGEKPGKPVTTVLDWVSTFVAVTTLAVFTSM